MTSSSNNRLTCWASYRPDLSSLSFGLDGGTELGESDDEAFSEEFSDVACLDALLRRSAGIVMKGVAAEKGGRRKVKKDKGIEEQ